MKNALKRLLDRVDTVFEEHSEVRDTDVREHIARAIHKGFIARQVGYVLPATFGMFSREGNEKVREAIQRFLCDPEVTAAAISLETDAARLKAFQDISVVSGGGRTYDEYFGHLFESKEVPEKSYVANLAVLKKTRRAPQPGDIFVMLPADGFYLYGRVISINADAGFGPCNLIYVYRPRSKEKTPLPELVCRDFLIPPIMTNKLPWTQGYLEFVENRPLTPADQLPQHCFKDTYGRYHDEHCNNLPGPIQPVGQWGVASFRGIDEEISKALGLHLPSD